MIINPKNDAQKRRAQAELRRMMIVLEVIGAKAFYPILHSQYIKVSKLITDENVSGVNKAIDSYDKRLINLLSVHGRRVAENFSKKVFDEGGKRSIIKLPELELKTPLEEFWAEMYHWISLHSTNRIKNDIQKTTKKNIRSILRKGMSEGESHKEIAKRIRELSPLINRSRALKIARTETHTVAVRSVDKSIQSVAGLKTEKEWNSAFDERTRIPHRSANGQRVKQNEMFVIGGERLEYPGDPRGSAGTIINCRCILLYYTIKK